MQLFNQLAGILLLVTFAANCRQRPEPMLVSWLLRVHEVRRDAKANERCKPIPALAVGVYSQLTVNVDGEVLYRVAIACDGNTQGNMHFGWPSRGNPEEAFPSKLSSAQLADLKLFLDTQKIKDIHDFMNAAPIFDNYDIEIARPDRPQRITVLAFMPSHVELQEHPALTQLVCKAKEIARAASKSGEAPDWCKDVSRAK